MIDNAQSDKSNISDILLQNYKKSEFDNILSRDLIKLTIYFQKNKKDRGYIISYHLKLLK